MSHRRPTTISVVINTYNRAASLETTLLGLQQCDAADVEVVVVNGPSTDATTEVLARWAPSIKVGHCPERNLAASRNIGIALAAGEVVAFIDDDAYPDPAWLRDLLDGFDDPEIAAVGGPTYDYTGAQLQARFSLADRLGDAWTLNDPDAPDPTWTHCVPAARAFVYTIGTNSSFRRQHLLEVGGFDEEYDYYLDETDVCLRLVDRGWVVRAADEPTVFHKFLPSDIRGPERAIRSRFAVIKNRTYFGLTHSRESHSFEELCRSMVRFIDLSRNDIESNVARGLLSEADRQVFEDDVHRASSMGFEHWLEGPKTRPSQWFDEHPAPWIPFPVAPDAVDGGRRLHICLLSQEHPPGRVNGIGRLVQSTAVALAARGHVVRVLTRGDDHDRVDLEDGVWVHRIVARPHARPDDLAALPAGLWDHSATMAEELARIDRKRSIDVVQVPNWDSEGLATLRDGTLPLALGIYTPLCTLARIDAHLLGEHQAMLDAECWSYRHADLLVASGPAVLDEVEGGYGIELDRRRVVVVPNGLAHPGPSRTTAEARHDEIIVLYVGRLERRKGVDGLLAAAPQLLDAHPEARLVIVGDDQIPGPDGRTHREVFAASPDGARLAGRVTFTGPLDDDERQAWYERCDVFVAPSRFESFGLVLLEAMMHGVPVVAGECTAMQTIVEGGAGLVASADRPELLAEAIGSLVGDRDERRRLGEVGRRRYEDRYSAAAMAGALVAAYRQAIADGRLGRRYHA
jgi:glycogen(starch) synthase